MGHTINICKEHGRPQITCWDCKDAEITTLRARIAELEREKVELMKDRDRLDWLEAEYETEQAMRRVPNYPRSLFRLNFPITREKIDEAREQACAAMKTTT